VKDRAGLYILRDGIARGELPAKRVLDSRAATPPLPMRCSAQRRGSRDGVRPKNASAERKALLEMYGAEVIFTDPLDGSDGAIRAARELAATRPDEYWYADQYNHPANARAHYVTTAEEIWAADRRPGHASRRGGRHDRDADGNRPALRELNPAIELVAVQPDGPFHGLEGLKHLATAIVPGIYDPALPSRTEFVATEDAEEAVRRLAKQTGLFVGGRPAPRSWRRSGCRPPWDGL